MIRIEHITLSLAIYDDSAGRRDVTFDVPLPDDAFLAVVNAKWREHYARVLAQLQGATDGKADSQST